MSPRETSNSARTWAGKHVIIAAAAVVALAAGTATALAAGHSGAGHSGASRTAADQQAGKARVASSSCTGPAGAAYVAVAGFQAFDAVNTANCDLVQQYNVGDSQVPNTGTSDTNYDSTDEGVTMYGDTLYFADTGNDTVAVINAANLDPGNYATPPETDIRVGFNPREGLVLNTVKYDDRPVLYRASIAEMLVPYADPKQSAYRKNAFDLGEYGVGMMANPLCPAPAQRQRQSVP